MCSISAHQWLQWEDIVTTFLHLNRNSSSTNQVKLDESREKNFISGINLFSLTSYLVRFLKLKKWLVKSQSFNANSPFFIINSSAL